MKFHSDPPAQCPKGCRYLGKAGGLPCCNYYLTTGIRRPCPAGPKCTVYERKSKMSHKVWSKEQAEALYRDGKTDKEIAAAVGISAVTVGAWRRSMNLPANGASRRPQPSPAIETIAESNECAPVSVAPPPEQVAAVDVCISAGSSTAAIRAGSLKEALALAEALVAFCQRGPSSE